MKNQINYSSDSTKNTSDIIRENAVHDLIRKNEGIQKDIFSILEIPEKFEKRLIHEDTYLNGIRADFTLIANNEVWSIIECKAGDIGVNDYVRGIGQLLQYEYFKETNFENGYKYNKNFKTTYIFPSSIIKNKNINIGRFKYPESTIIIELNDNNFIPRIIPKEELHKISKAEENNLATISNYYVRDNRVFEIYMLLKILMFKEIKGEGISSRSEFEKNVLRKLETPNNRNWRNAFITLSSLGFILSNNYLSESGKRMALLNYNEFLIKIYNDYLKPYCDLLMNLFEKESNLNLKNTDICEKIRSQFDGKDVLFLSESNGRYISSWLNILRDDFGCLSFLPRNKNRKLNYNISSLNNESLFNKINEYTQALPYLKRVERIIN